MRAQRAVWAWGEAGAGSAVKAGRAARAHVHAVVGRSGSSFYWAMRLLPAARREAMYAIYAFCREVDDIADEPGTIGDKLARLAGWREEIARLYVGSPQRATARALLGPVHDYGLPREEFLEIIDGMEMDARERMRAPPLVELELYCRRVAGAVGLLSIRAFGASRAEAEDFALALGDALQLTNILRDLDEDAARGRLYVPRELLAARGIEATVPQAVMACPRFPAACEELALIARARFERARGLLPRAGARELRPAVLMMQVYERLLETLCARGFEAERQPVRLSRLERLGLALRFRLFAS